MKRILYPMAAAALLAGACNNPQKTDDATTTPTDTTVVKDWHTLSNTDSVTVKHLDLDLAVDLDKKQLGGWATWDIENKTGAHTLRLDDNKLIIDTVLVDGKY